MTKSNCDRLNGLAADLEHIATSLEATTAALADMQPSTRDGIELDRVMAARRRLAVALSSSCSAFVADQPRIP